MDQEQHAILDGRCKLYRRVEGGKWQCSTFLEGRNHRVSTGETSLRAAKEFAEDWYLTLRGKQNAGTLIVSAGPTFREIAAKWELEYDAMTGGTRNRTYVDGNSRRLKKYLNPFFGDLPIADVTTAKVHEYRFQRMSPDEGAKAPARNTLHQEMVTLRQVLKAGMRYGVLANLPDLSEPYTTGHKVSHRAWFLDETKLRVDREGNPRSAYSLRHTYISMRLEEGADIYQIAKNCRTSVEMIEKHYASHIKTSISAKAVNVRAKPLPKRQREELERRNAHRYGKTGEVAETDSQDA